MNAIGVQNSLIKKKLFHYMSKKKKIEQFFTQPLEKSQLTILYIETGVLINLQKKFFKSTQWLLKY